MDSLTKVFLKNVLLMFLIILTIFYFLGFEYLIKLLELKQIDLDK